MGTSVCVRVFVRVIVDCFAEVRLMALAATCQRNQTLFRNENNCTRENVCALSICLTSSNGPKSETQGRIEYYPSHRMHRMQFQGRSKFLEINAKKEKATEICTGFKWAAFVYRIWDAVNQSQSSLFLSLFHWIGLLFVLLWPISQHNNFAVTELNNIIVSVFDNLDIALLAVLQIVHANGIVVQKRLEL